MSGTYYCAPGLDMWERSEIKDTTYRDPADWFTEAITKGNTDAGVRVNETTALAHGPVWQAVNILAGDVGQLPIHVMRRVDERTVEKDRTHPASRLLRLRPNDWQLPSVWKETMMSWALIWGNAISEIIRDRAGRPLAFRLWLPDSQWANVEENGELWYYQRVDGKTRAVPAEDIFHITGLAQDGIWGWKFVDVVKNVLGHGIALERHGSSLFKNGARPGMVLEHPGRLSPEARDQLKREWKEKHAGPENAHEVAVLWEGMKANPFMINNDDAQWLESRKLDREQVASLFNLPAFKLNALENSSVRANLEEQNRDYFQTSLSRWLNRFAEECREKLLTTPQKQRETHFFKWFPEAFLKGDVAKRFAAYNTAIASRIMNPNEVRQLEDMNPYEGGDEFLNPNIDTADSGSDDEQPADDDAPEAMDAHWRLIEAQVAHILTRERMRVEQMARSTVKFVDRVDWYYMQGEFKQAADEILAPAVASCRAVGMKLYPVAAIDNHAHESYQLILQIAGSCGRDSLRASVAELVSRWDDRQGEFIESLRNGVPHENQNAVGRGGYGMAL